jgi:hypothetical protein
VFAVPATPQQPKCPCVHDEVTWTQASYVARSDSRCCGQTLTHCRWARHLHGNEGWQAACRCRSTQGRSTLAGDGHRVNTIGLAHPAPEHVGVQTLGHRHRRGRHTGLPTGPNDLVLEFGAVAPTCSPSRRLHNNRSVHVSTMKLRGHKPPMSLARIQDAAARRLRIPRSRRYLCDLQAVA